MEAVVVSVMFVIDNSSPTLNADFYPSRLEAQKQTADLLIRSWLRGGKTEVGIAVMEGEFPVIQALHADERAVTAAVARIAVEPRPLRLMEMVVKEGRMGRLLRSLKAALLAFRACSERTRERRIVLFVSEPAVRDEKEKSELEEFREEQGSMLRGLVGRASAVVEATVVVLGEIAEEWRNFLRKLMSGLSGNADFRMVIALPGGLELSEQVLQSRVFGDDGEIRKIAAGDDDPYLEQALRASAIEAGYRKGPSNREVEDFELARAIEESLQEVSRFGEPSLAAAIEASQREVEEDPGLADAIRLSMMQFEEEDGEAQNGEEGGLGEEPGA
jgi:hypothetical protein